MNHPTPPTLEHSTVVLGKTFEAPVTRLYAALSDPLERALVGTLADDTVALIDECNFRVGGRDFCRFGLRGAPAFRSETVYHRIVAPSLIVATEIVHTGETCVAIDLVTYALSEDTTGTARLRLTIQSLDLCADRDLTEAAGGRHPALIEALSRHLHAAPRHPTRSRG